MKAYELGTIIIGGIFLSWMAYGAIFESNVEQPNYKLVSKDKGFEIRIYKQLSVISTSYKNQNSAFRSLFRMIDGNNSKNQKIPMTAPVI